MKIDEMQALPAAIEPEVCASFVYGSTSYHLLRQIQNGRCSLDELVVSTGWNARKISLILGHLKSLLKVTRSEQGRLGSPHKHYAISAQCAELLDSMGPDGNRFLKVSDGEFKRFCTDKMGMIKALSQAIEDQGQIVFLCALTVWEHGPLNRYQLATFLACTPDRARTVLKLLCGLKILSMRWQRYDILERLPMAMLSIHNKAAQPILPRFPKSHAVIKQVEEQLRTKVNG